MKIATATLAAAAASLLAAPALQAQDQGQDEDSETAETMTKGEARLAKMLEGRVAGKPQSCIRMWGNVDLTVIDKTALVYKQGGTLFVNIPSNADHIDDRDALVTRRTGSSLCRTDIVTTQDRFNGMYTGNLFLSDFVPYRKAES